MGAADSCCVIRSTGKPDKQRFQRAQLQCSEDKAHSFCTLRAPRKSAQDDRAFCFTTSTFPPFRKCVATIRRLRWSTSSLVRVCNPTTHQQTARSSQFSSKKKVQFFESSFTKGFNSVSRIQKKRYNSLSYTEKRSIL